MTIFKNAPYLKCICYQSSINDLKIDPEISVAKRVVFTPLHHERPQITDHFNGRVQVDLVSLSGQCAQSPSCWCAIHQKTSIRKKKQRSLPLQRTLRTTRPRGIPRCIYPTRPRAGPPHTWCCSRVVATSNQNTKRDHNTTPKVIFSISYVLCEGVQ